jgi:hypothetical protein
MFIKKFLLLRVMFSLMIHTFAVNLMKVTDINRSRNSRFKAEDVMKGVGNIHGLHKRNYSSMHYTWGVCCQWKIDEEQVAILKLSFRRISLHYVTVVLYQHTF